MRRIFPILGATALFTFQGSAQISNITSMAWENVPVAVQQAVQAKIGGETIQIVERGEQNGMTIYSLEVPDAEGVTRIIVTENGLPFSPQPNAIAQPVVAPVIETPAPAVETLPEGVTREVVAGQTIYNIETAGQTQASQVQIGADGQVLSATQTAQIATQMEKIPWNAVPRVVQNTIQSQTGPGQLLDITRGTYYGQSVYEVIYVQDSQRTRLRVSENGAVLGQAIISAEDNRVMEVGQTVGLSQIPIAVQTTLQAAAGDQPLESVRLEVVGGRVIYVGTYRQNGQPVSLRVSQTGQILR